MAASGFILIFAVVVFVVSVALFVWWVIELIDALKTPSATWEAAGQSQILYVVLMVFLGIIGTILYAAVARPALRSVSV